MFFLLCLYVNIYIYLHIYIKNLKFDNYNPAILFPLLRISHVAMII